MEIFTGVYEIKMPNPKPNSSNRATGSRRSSTVNVNEISSDTVKMRGVTNEEETAHANITLKALTSKRGSRAGSRESLAISVPKHPKPKSPEAAKNVATTTVSATKTAATTADESSSKKDSLAVAKNSTTMLTAAQQSQISAVSSSEVKTASSSMSSSSCSASMMSSAASTRMTHQQQQQQVVTEQKTMTSSFSSSSSSSATMMSSSTISNKTEQQHQQQIASHSSNNTLLEHNSTVVEGQKFNITNALKKSSRQSSTENVSIVSHYLKQQQHQKQEVTSSTRARHASSTSSTSNALKGLDAALEAVAKEQKAAEVAATKYQPKTKPAAGASNIQVSENEDGSVTSVTVSLPSSRRTSRRGSVDLGQGGGLPPKQRSRRNSIDLYSADYDIKMMCDKATAENEAAKNRNQPTPQKMKMIQRSSSHIRIDDIANSKLKLCPRCHSPHHTVNECTEFADLKCPRCLEWNHWEDSCWTNEEPESVSKHAILLYFLSAREYKYAFLKQACTFLREHF